jgi:hypothetical protein
MVATLLEGKKVSELLRIDDGSPEIGREKEFGTAEVRPGNADDREGILVDPHSPAYYGRVTIKVAVPERIAENDLGHAVGPMFFGSMDESA